MDINFNLCEGDNMKKIFKSLLEALAAGIVITLFYVVMHEGSHIGLAFGLGCSNITIVPTSLGIAATAEYTTSTLLQITPYLAIEEIINYCVLPYVIIGLLIYYLLDDVNGKKTT